ncbi:hypothetical protein [Legionella sainthelensi]|uniref:hypothetical protein n=1 Tax=Legionella sainthelensi TaxID=28087 RepID=UPI000F6F4AB7|nr:hypothetical protein [Legionella sainthelensi]VEH36807.1 Uncharacterised protein [Legionella sainthelensi]
MVKNKGIKPILELSAAQAKKYFLKEESYCNFDLPTYFKFEGLLKEIEKKLGEKNYPIFIMVVNRTDQEISKMLIIAF